MDNVMPGLLYNQKKKKHYLFNRRLVGPQSLSGHFEKRKICPCPDSNLRPLVVSIVTILGVLPQLPGGYCNGFFFFFCTKFEVCYLHYDKTLSSFITTHNMSGDCNIVGLSFT
jgi:hypothetical protein